MEGVEEEEWVAEEGVRERYERFTRYLRPAGGTVT